MKYNIVIFGFSDKTKELNFRKCKMLYTFPNISYKRCFENEAVLTDYSNILLIADHEQLCIIMKREKQQDEKILSTIPYLKQTKGILYNLYIPILKANTEFLAYYICNHVINHDNLSKEELYKHEFINSKYLDIFFNGI